MKWINIVWDLYWRFGVVFVTVACAGVPGIKLKTTNIFSEGTEYPEMNAVIGSTVSLPCNLSPPSPDDTISLVLWYRLDLPNPIYTLDARSVTVAADARHFASPVLKGRARFNMSPQRPSAASLTLEGVGEGDAGEYRCRVDFKRGRTLSWLVKLNVIVPTDSLVIKDKNNKTLAGTIGPYKEGSSLTLICEANGGRPPPSVWWRRGLSDAGGNQSFPDAPPGVVRSELLIEALKRDDLLAEITCLASNTNLSAPATAAVKLDISLSPTDVQITTPQTPISAGERVEIVCSSQGSRPPAKITWWKDGKDLKRFATDEVTNDVTTSKLFFTPSSDDNDKILTCRAENPDNSDSALEDQWMLNIYYPPLLSVSFSSQPDAAIREGGDVHLECHVQANPPAAEVRWRFRSQQLLHDPSKGVLIRNASLLLQDVQRSQRGPYRCMAANLEGEGVSDETFLRIHFAPVCVRDQRITYGVARHEEANVSCAVEADPPGVTFCWSFNSSGGGEPLNILSYSTDGATRSVARYIPRTRLDYGQLQCYATNAVGKMKEPCVFTILPTGPPEPIQNCTVTNATSTSLLLQCDAGDDGGLPQTFHLEVYSMADETLRLNATAADAPLFVAERLRPAAAYILVLYASNTKGRSTSVALTAWTLYAAEHRTGDGQPVTISAILVVLMGTVGALVILAIIIIFIMKARGDKRGKNEDKASEEKTPSCSENVFDGKQTDIFSKNYQTGEWMPVEEDALKEYVDLTPNARTERIYEKLGDKGYTYENVIHRNAHYPSNQNPHSHHPIASIVAR